MKRLWPIAFVFFGMILTNCGAQTTSPSGLQPTPETSPINLSREEQIKSVVKGCRNPNQIKPEIEVIKLDDSAGYRVMVKCKIIGAVTKRKLIAWDAIGFYEVIFARKDIDDVEEALFETYTDLIDGYGQSHVEAVAKFAINKDLGRKINWKAMNNEILLNVLDFALRNKLKGQGGNEFGMYWFHNAVAAE